MYKTINIDIWERRESYLFFRDFEDPRFGTCANVNVSDLFKSSKIEGNSFFIGCMYGCLKIMQDIENFRLRILEDVVVSFHTIHGGSTILFENETFGFGYYNYIDDFKDFQTHTRDEIAKTRANPVFEPMDDRIDLVHFSSMPWVTFTAVKHAHTTKTNPSIPRITIGKIFREGEKMLMPLSLESHHGLTDGYHHGVFFQKLETLFAHGQDKG